MKQTFTNYPSFSAFFSTNKQNPNEQALQSRNAASPWVVRNLMAYSVALFVTKTKLLGSYMVLMN